MQNDTIYAKLTDILRDVFDDENVIATPDLTAADVPDWDSVSHIRLMLTVEKSFGIKFSVSELGNLENVGDLAQLIQAKTS